MKIQIRYDLTLSLNPKEIQILKFEIEEDFDAIDTCATEYVIRFNGDKLTCNCPSYIYRGHNCKHVKMVKEVLHNKEFLETRQISLKGI